MIDKMALKSKLTEILGMLGDDEDEGASHEAAETLAESDAGDGGSEGVTDLCGTPEAAPSQEPKAKSKKLDIIAATLKRKMGR